MRTKKCGRKLILQVFLRGAKCLRENGAKTNKEKIANRNWITGLALRVLYG